MSAPTHYTRVTEALNSLTVQELKALSARLPDSRSFARKGEIVDEIRPYLKDDQLRSLWSKLDKLQKAAVSEVVHSDEFEFDRVRFGAKYGELPNIGSNTKPSLLNLFFYSGAMPDTLKAELKHFVPAPEPLKVSSTDDPPEAMLREDKHWDYQTRKTIVETVEIPLTRRDTEAAAQADLVAMLQLVTAGKLRCSDATMVPSGATAKLVVAMLQGADWYDAPQPEVQSGDIPVGPIKAFAWPLLL